MKYLKYVNARQGTKSAFRYSNGNTLPLSQTPFGMIAFAPQTEGGVDLEYDPDTRAYMGGNGWWFNSEHRSLEGLRLTHQASPWLGDYGTLLFTPQSDLISNEPVNAWSGYRPEEAQINPDYIKLGFLRAAADLEVTTSQRCAKLKVAFDTYCKKCLTIFNIRGTGEFSIDKENEVIYGITDGAESGLAKDFKMFFIITLQKGKIDFEKTEILNNNTKKALIHLALKEDSLEFDVAISYISYEQAKVNYREIADKSFDKVREECAGLWEKHLGSIEFETDNKDELRTFYSCMYRTGIFPHKAFEIDNTGQNVHYSPSTGKVCKGKRYTDNGFWDTYRTLFPLFSLINRELYHDMIESVLGDFKECGWLPRWISIGENGTMPSTLVDSVLSQAVVSGIADESDFDEIFSAMCHHAENVSENKIFGRRGIKEFKEIGYVPCDKYTENVNLTLDFSYSDYCIAKVAEKIGNTEAQEKYLKRSQNYKNIFDKETGFMRAKNSKGEFKPDFDAFTWGGDYTEASAWQTTFSVPHDLNGLATLMGGKEALIKKLDELFSNKPFYRVGVYGREIHEITEFAAVDLGLCAISNQPSFLLPFIYAYLGEKEKTAYWANRICKEVFSYKADGFPGDEDNGAMSSWYVLARMGIYPVCPADDTWITYPTDFKGKVNGQDIDSLKKNKEVNRI